MIRNLALAALTAAFILSGCTEKEKPAAPQKTEETKAVTPPVAKKAPEERAEKECAAPLETGPAQERKIGERAAVQNGTKLTFQDKDADGTLTLGVLGALNEDSGENLVNVKKFLKFFQDEKADAIVVTGDIGEAYPENIARALVALADSNLPVFTIIGNRECRAAFTDGVAAAQREKTNIVNLNTVRAVEFPEATLVSLPGYHDAEFIACKTGCQYYKSTVDEVVRLAKEAKNPVVLVSHGPPHGTGSQALDYTRDGNVGDPQITQAIQDANIPFGLFSNIKEAGGRAVDSPQGTTLIGQDKASKNLYLNPGPADAVGWELNDGTTSNGMVAVFKIKGDEASWKLFRAKPLSGAEKAQAAKLQPAPHNDDEPMVAPASDKKPAAPAGEQAPAK